MMRSALLFATLLACQIFIQADGATTAAPTRFIVALKTKQPSGIRLATYKARQLGLKVVHEFKYLNAFSFAVPADMTSQTRKQAIGLLERHSVVAYVRPVRNFEARGTAVPIQAGQQVGAGVRRIGAALGNYSAPASDYAVAVIDSGIQLNHPDLNVFPGKNCIAAELGTPPNDINGHGTHCAGIVGAKNNKKGMLGVAPGTKLYSVKVVGANFRGTEDDEYCGWEWILDNAERLKIRVVSDSLDGTYPERAELIRRESCANTTMMQRKLICMLTAKGVVVVAAAGNYANNFEAECPAAYPEVLAVTAMAEADGKPGGIGGQLSAGFWSAEQDDRAAYGFSNWVYAADSLHVAHTVSAPGVYVISTIPNSSYDSWTGTSMATPHAAGTVALCLGSGGRPGPCAGKSVKEIISYIRSVALRRMAAGEGSIQSKPSRTCARGAAGLATLVPKWAKDATLSIKLPFPFKHLGREYGRGRSGSVWVNSNMFVSFGAGYKVISGEFPDKPYIFIGAGLYSWRRVYGGAGPSAGCYRVRVEGCAGTSDCGTANIVWEATFCSNHTISLCVVRHKDPEAYSVMGDGVQWQYPYTLAANTQHVFRGFDSLKAPVFGNGFLGDPRRPVAGRYYGPLVWAGDFVKYPAAGPRSAPQNGTAAPRNG